MLSPTRPSPGFCLQDEVAHTVTESRVLQNTRHPFLTVSAIPLSLCTVGGPAGQPLWPELRERAQPATMKHRVSVGQMAGSRCCWAAQVAWPKPQG